MKKSRLAISGMLVAVLAGTTAVARKGCRPADNPVTDRQLTKVLESYLERHRPPPAGAPRPPHLWAEPVELKQAIDRAAAEGGTRTEGMASLEHDTLLVVESPNGVLLQTREGGRAVTNDGSLGGSLQKFHRPDLRVFVAETPSGALADRLAEAGFPMYQTYASRLAPLWAAPRPIRLFAVGSLDPAKAAVIYEHQNARSVLAGMRELTKARVPLVESRAELARRLRACADEGAHPAVLAHNGGRGIVFADGTAMEVSDFNQKFGEFGCSLISCETYAAPGQSLAITTSLRMDAAVAAAITALPNGPVPPADYFFRFGRKYWEFERQYNRDRAILVVSVLAAPAGGIATVAYVKKMPSPPGPAPTRP